MTGARSTNRGRLAARAITRKVDSDRARALAAAQQATNMARATKAAGLAHVVWSTQSFDTWLTANASRIPLG